jgi:hypothetical protein
VISLWFRLARGAPFHTAVRLGLVSGMLSVIGASLLIFVQFTQVFASWTAVDAARTPAPYESGSADLRLVSLWQPTQFGQLLRVTVSGASGSAPRPPGVKEWPPVGKCVVSPALAGLPADSAVRGSLGPVSGLIGESGLRGPNELVAYCAISGSLPETRSVTGFGAMKDASDNDLPFQFFVGLALIIGTGFILARTAFALSSQWVRTRTDALLRLGAGYGVVRAQSQLDGLVGGLVAWPLSLLNYLVGVQLLGRVSLLGASWSTSQLALSAPAAATSFLIVPLAVAFASRPDRPAVGRANSRFAGVATALIVIHLACVGVACVILSRRTAGPDEGAGLWVAVTALACLGLYPIAARAISLVTAVPLARLRRPAWLRLGGQIAEVRAAEFSRGLALLAVLTYTVTLGLGWAANVNEVAWARNDQAQVTIDLDALDAKDRAALAGVPGERVANLTDPDIDGFGLVVGSCRDVGVVMPGIVDQAQCRAGQQGGSGGPWPRKVLLVDGRTVPLAESPRTEAGFWSERLEWSDAAWIWQTRASVTFYGNVSDGTFDALVGRLLRAVPGGDFDSNVSDPLLLRASQVGGIYIQVAGFLSGVMAAFGLASFFLAARRRSTLSDASLRALGMSALSRWGMTVASHTLGGVTVTVVAGIHAVLASLLLVAVNHGSAAMIRQAPGVVGSAALLVLVVDVATIIVAGLISLRRFRRSDLLTE